MSEEKQQEAPTAGRTIWNLLPLIILGLYLCHFSPSKRPGVQLEQCGKHLHEIGVMIEKDRLLSDDKLYNKDLKEIYGKHPMPACPVGGKDAYIEGYQVAEDRRSYLLVCKGDHHKDAGVPSDYPRIAFSIPETDSSEKKSSTPESAGATPGPSATPGVAPGAAGGASVGATPAATPAEVSASPASSPTVSGSGSPTPAVAATPAVDKKATAHAQGQDQKHKPEEATGQKEQKGDKGLDKGLVQVHVSPAPSATP